MRTIIIKIDDKLYEELVAKAKSEGLVSVTEYVRALILRDLEKVKQGEVESKVGVGVEKIVQLIERKLMDRINPFTSKVDEIARKYAEIIERIEAIEDKIKELEEKLSQQVKEAKPEKVRGEEVERKRERKSALEILRENKALFESDIVSRIKNRDAFFNKLQREGAKIIETKDERIAIDPDFWRIFLEKISNITTQNEDEIKNVLDDIEFRLFKKLKESALLIFDVANKRWKLVS
ncbi:MAG: hypothetical protein JHC33_06610 [Ignisphaera sp.]|nr:hypothetical protein [Ignisphaera sp.]